MPIEVVDIIKQKNAASFPTTEDIDMLGGMRVVANLTERDEYLSTGSKASFAKTGMLIFVQSDQKLYTLDSGGGSFTEFVGGGGGGAVDSLLKLRETNWAAVTAGDPAPFSTVVLSPAAIAESFTNTGGKLNALIQNRDATGDYLPYYNDFEVDPDWRNHIVVLDTTISGANPLQQTPAIFPPNISDTGGLLIESDGENSLGVAFLNANNLVADSVVQAWLDLSDYTTNVTTGSDPEKSLLAASLRVDSLAPTDYYMCLFTVVSVDVLSVVFLKFIAGIPSVLGVTSFDYTTAGKSFATDPIGFRFTAIDNGTNVDIELSYRYYTGAGLSDWTSVLAATDTSPGSLLGQQGGMSYAMLGRTTSYTWTPSSVGTIGEVYQQTSPSSAMGFLWEISGGGPSYQYKFNSSTAFIGGVYNPNRLTNQSLDHTAMWSVGATSARIDVAYTLTAPSSSYTPSQAILDYGTIVVDSAGNTAVSVSSVSADGSGGLNATARFILQADSGGNPVGQVFQLTGTLSGSPDGSAAFGTPQHPSAPEYSALSTFAPTIANLDATAKSGTITLLNNPTIVMDDLLFADVNETTISATEPNTSLLQATYLLPAATFATYFNDAEVGAGGNPFLVGEITVTGTLPTVVSPPDNAPSTTGTDVLRVAGNDSLLISLSGSPVNSANSMWYNLTNATDLEKIWMGNRLDPIGNTSIILGINKDVTGGNIDWTLASLNTFPATIATGSINMAGIGLTVNDWIGFRLTTDDTVTAGDVTYNLEYNYANPTLAGWTNITSGTAVGTGIPQGVGNDFIIVTDAALGATWTGTADIDNIVWGDADVETFDATNPVESTLNPAYAPPVTERSGIYADTATVCNFVDTKVLTYSANIELPTFTVNTIEICLGWLNTTDNVAYCASVDVNANNEFATRFPFINSMNLSTGVKTTLSNAINATGSGSGTGGAFPLGDVIQVQVDLINTETDRVLIAVYIDGYFYGQSSIDISSLTTKSFSPFISFVNRDLSSQTILVDAVEITTSNTLSQALFSTKAIRGTLATGTFTIPADGVKGQTLIDKDDNMFALGD